MSNFMKWGREWVSKQRRSINSVSVSYVRGETTYENVTVTLAGVTSFEQTSITKQHGASIDSRLRDFIIAKEDLPVAEPALGDRILWNGIRFDLINSHALHYTGTEHQGSCWAWTDPNCISYRIHARKVGREYPF